MTDHDLKALQILVKLSRCRPSELGEELSEGVATRKPQCYARYGGKVLHRLKREGLALQHRDSDGRTLWSPTLAGVVKAG